MDAAILFSDILVIPYALGQNLTFEAGEGPRLPPLETLKDIEKLSFDDKKLFPVYETLKRLRVALAPEKALIGFAGAPFTVACYMVQGFGDGEFSTVKKFIWQNPKIFDALMEKLVETTTHYLLQQIRSGADVVQIFDSWAGILPEDLFRRYVIVPTQRIIKKIHQVYPGFPVIGFPRKSGAMYMPYAIETGITGLGLDESAPLKRIADDCGDKICVQGNLDPQLLLIGGTAMEEGIRRILDMMRNTPFIFNLGHGVIKETPPEHVAKLSSIVKNHIC
jgi:uroporphyrinogen decarboxylase